MAYVGVQLFVLAQGQGHSQSQGDQQEVRAAAAGGF